jgi:hypothetical protein
VIAFAVARRTSEIGLRMALGASGGAVLRMVLLDAGRMAAVGIVIGLGAAFALSRYIESQLFGVRAADPLIYVGALCGLMAVAALAAIVPAWRASRIDPVSPLDPPPSESIWGPEEVIFHLWCEIRQAATDITTLREQQGRRDPPRQRLDRVVRICYRGKPDEQACCTSFHCLREQPAAWADVESG